MTRDSPTSEEIVTNVSVVMLTLNEAENIEATLNSAEPTFDELVIVDGGSTDGTVEIAEQWCRRNEKQFKVVESSEREYLAEGTGTQRRRGERVATRDYTMALDADTRVEVLNEDWFKRPFDHYAYSHTRVKPSGKIERDWRLYQPDPPFADGTHPRWRGIIHEEIQTRDGIHVGEVYEVGEAPIVHYDRRHSAMDTITTQGEYQHAHDPRAGGNAGRTLEKQHYLLHQAMGSEQQRAYLNMNWQRYYNNHARLVRDDYMDIRDEFELPAIAYEADDAENTFDTGWELEDGKPSMKVTDHDKGLVDRIF